MRVRNLGEKSMIDDRGSRAGVEDDGAISAVDLSANEDGTIGINGRWH